MLRSANSMTRRARSGIDFFDHADIYGRAMHGCEKRFGEALGLSGAERDEITLQTKCGIVPAEGVFDFSYEHIVASGGGVAAALRTDRIDVLLLHRPDALVRAGGGRARVRRAARRRARCAHSASPTTPRARSTC